MTKGIAVANHDSWSTPVPAQDPSLPGYDQSNSTPNNTNHANYYAVPLAETDSRRTTSTICGIRTRLFWIVLVAILLLLGAAIGGAVGGTLGLKKTSKSGTSTCNLGEQHVSPSEIYLIETDYFVRFSRCSQIPALATSSGSVSTAIVEPTATAGTTVASTVGGSTIVTTISNTIVTYISNTVVSYGGPPTTTSTTGISPTIAASQSVGSIAAATIQDSGGSVHLFIPYQKGSQIRYRKYYSGGPNYDAQTLELKISPKPGSPLATLVYLGSSTFTTILFYMDDDNNIVEAYHSSPLRSGSLSFDSTKIIVSSTDVYSYSSLAAINVDGGPKKLYYQRSDKKIQEIVGNDGWGKGQEFETALDGSPITLSMVDSPSVNVYYLNDQNTLRQNWLDKASDSWDGPFDFSSSMLQNWPNNNPRFAAAGNTDPITQRFYYIDSNNQVQEYVRESGTWTAQLGSWPQSEGPPGGIAAIGWKDQIRFYYMSGGELAQGYLDGTTWRKTSMEQP
ncbi:hypothetical protein BJ875DRAFT_489620 [Amylocarpus encephaloides]|uniref:Fucose-specific lectin n=1 Tax=Amylocarpus encephaloides TaxID=45428 RepID=A0A9P7Y7R4_9HELO|nr:hypothetical protein BJ875DRAFT_489620 [Amylocarpus encephaloides]